MSAAIRKRKQRERDLSRGLTQITVKIPNDDESKIEVQNLASELTQKHLQKLFEVNAKAHGQQEIFS